MEQAIGASQRLWATVIAAAGTCLLTAVAPVGAQAQTAQKLVPSAAPPPIEAFFGDLEIDDGELSHSGRWLALAAQPPGQRRGLAIYDLHGNEPPREVARFSDIDIRDYHWVGEDHLAFELLDTRRGSGEQRKGRTCSTFAVMAAGCISTP